MWINLEDDRTWHYVPAGEVFITDKVGRRRRKVMATGKRAPGSPSHIKAKKGAKPATSTDGESAKKDAEPPKKKKSGTSVVVSRTGAKQGELPGVETSKRKIAEIEDLAEIYDDKKAAHKKSGEELKDAEENLAVSMKKHNRTSYSRTTWGRVKMKESKESISFKRDKQNKKDE